MAAKQQFPTSSRSVILRLLCTAPRTVRELADAIGISITAVRKLLSRLDSDGLVSYERVVRGVGKPAHEYTITPDGELHVSKAYLPLLDALLKELEEKVPQNRIENLLRHAGRRLASSTGTGTMRQRLSAGAAALNELGGAAVVKGTRARVRIECTCCAIGAVVMAHPVACKSMEALLTELVGVPLRERCQRDGRPLCRFEPVP